MSGSSESGSQAYSWRSCPAPFGVELPIKGRKFTMQCQAESRGSTGTRALLIHGTENHATCESRDAKALDSTKGPSECLWGQADFAATPPQQVFDVGEARRTCSTSKRERPSEARHLCLMALPLPWADPMTRNRRPCGGHSRRGYDEADWQCAISLGTPFACWSAQTASCELA